MFTCIARGVECGPALLRAWLGMCACIARGMEYSQLGGRIVISHTKAISSSQSRLLQQPCLNQHHKP